MDESEWVALVTRIGCYELEVRSRIAIASRNAAFAARRKAAVENPE